MAKPVKFVWRSLAFCVASRWNVSRYVRVVRRKPSKQEGSRRWNARSQPLARCRETGLKSSSLKSLGPEAPAYTPFRLHVALYVAQYKPPMALGAPQPVAVVTAESIAAGIYLSKFSKMLSDKASRMDLRHSFRAVSSSCPGVSAVGGLAERVAAV